MESHELLRRIEKNLSFSFRKKFPIILQTEVAECGLACLAMIIKWYGSDNDLLSLRHQFGVSNRGVTLENLVNIASEIGLSYRPLSVDIDELEKIRLPCVLHWDFNHFVVLTKCYNGNYVIHDPALGKIKISKKELSKHFTGIVLELWPEQRFKKTKERTRLWSSIQSVDHVIESLFLQSASDG